ncbi:MAG: ribonuclease R [Oscillospiraceae bacterium]|nr:ribonuclease R [Oscillospiraceae bacterium]
MKKGLYKNNMKKRYSDKIIKTLYSADKPLNISELAKVADVKKTSELKPALNDLSRKGLINQSKNGWRLAGKDFFKAEVMRVFKAHGFIRDVKTSEEFFTPGRKLLGSVPGDFVLARVTNKERGENLNSAAEVVLIEEESQNVLTGMIVKESGGFYILPDSFAAEPIFINSYSGFKPREGDKVSFSLKQRGERHSEHVADITSIYGNAGSARVCVSAYLDEKNIPLEFPKEAREDAKIISDKGVKDSENANRLDLRGDAVFTIDGADTKDIDDAVSAEKTGSGYRLGVHIADVSHYVRKNSPLDLSALERGTSVYIADLVVPMLPKELSNGICSLNPKADRLALSCIMELNNNAEITGFKFAKTIIKSRLQGVYSEINELLENNGDNNLKEKYAEVITALPVMKELAAKLQKNRKDRGAPFIETSETKIICDEAGKCIDVQKRESGKAENIIEEFMLAANNCAAKLAMEAEIPFVYRIHEAPAVEKLDALKETLALIGFEYTLQGRGAADLAGIIEKARGTEKAGIINMTVLRAMMKAKYSDEPVGHYGLVMKEYAHFTSPIRRYPDLIIHRILSDYITNSDKAGARKRYGKFVHEAAVKSSHAELRAVNAERDCEKFFMAEYMQNHVGGEFDGIVSGVTQSGIFVILANTVEGRISSDSLGVCAVDNNISLTEQLSGKRFALGDRVRVKCTSANVAFGMIDFEII